MTRVLAWDGCVNVRDLGGLPLEDGGETAYRVVVRSDSVRTLTDAGWEALAAYGVERVVDLRFEEELAEDPPRELDVGAEAIPSARCGAHTGSDEVERKRLRVWASAPREAMVDVLAELDARAYLERAGAAPAALDRLRARLRGEA